MLGDALFPVTGITATSVVDVAGVLHEEHAQPAAARKVCVGAGGLGAVDTVQVR